MPSPALLSPVINHTRPRRLCSACGGVPASHTHRLPLCRNILLLHSAVSFNSLKKLISISTLIPCFIYGEIHEITCDRSRSTRQDFQFLKPFCNKLCKKIPWFHAEAELSKPTSESESPVLFSFCSERHVCLRRVAYHPVIFQPAGCTVHISTNTN